jgi:predicted fused transcriptional regulator/phosphomethylpyrimidine kinase
MRRHLPAVRAAIGVKVDEKMVRLANDRVDVVLLQFNRKRVREEKEAEHGDHLAGQAELSAFDRRKLMMKLFEIHRLSVK